MILPELNPWLANRAESILSGGGAGSTGQTPGSGVVVKAPSPIPKYQSNASP